MNSNMVKIAIRSLFKNGLVSIINLTGLSVGLAVSLLIALWILDELSFNTEFPNHDRIGQVLQNVTNNSEVLTWRTMPWPLAEELRSNYGSDFQYISLATLPEEVVLSHNEKVLPRAGRYVESSFLKIFNVQFVIGGRETMADPNSIFLSESTAKAFFGQESPLNNIMIISNSDTGPVTVQVAGVYRDFPARSDLQGVDFIASWEMLANTPWIQDMQDPWKPNVVAIYVQLKSSSDFADASARIRNTKLRKVNAEIANKMHPLLFIHKMTDWHLYSEFKNGENIGGRIQQVRLFGVIGLFVLLMACINFMNLSTAKAELRAKEVGVRKSIGSRRLGIMLQFLIESVLVTFLSFVLAIMLVLIALPSFNLLATTQIAMPWSDWRFWGIAFAFCILTGMFAGSYPSFYLSSINPVQALKGTYQDSKYAILLRRGLVVIQFAITTILIVGTITVLRQLEFAKDRPNGFEPTSLIAIPVVGDRIHKHFAAFAAELESTGAAFSVSEGEVPIQKSWISSGFSWQGMDPNLSSGFAVFSASANFGKTVGWKIITGRDFEADNSADSTALIVNEAAVQYMGLKEPVSESLDWLGKRFTIIGVVQNIVFDSPYDIVQPAIYRLWPNPGVIIVKVNNGAGYTAALVQIERVFKKFNPEEPFRVQFVQDEYNLKFGTVNRVGKLAETSAILAILISCLGLFGFVSFVTAQRTKELGVRKVLGASGIELWLMLSKEFVMLSVVSCGISMPITYYLANAWLEKYEYRTSFPWFALAEASLAILVLTLVTTSYHIGKAVSMNPVKALRTE